MFSLCVCVFVGLTRLECRSSRRRRCRGGQNSSNRVLYCITTRWGVRLSSNHMSWQCLRCKHFHTFDYSCLFFFPLLPSPFLFFFSLRLKSGVCASMTVDTVKRGVLPFLRCAALFFHCLTGVPAPEELSSTAGESQSLSTYMST